MSGTQEPVNSAGFAPDAPSTADRPNMGGADLGGTGYSGFQMPTDHGSLPMHITTPSEDRNGGISWGPSSPLDKSGYPGIDGSGSHQWQGHHPGITPPAMHSTGHAGIGPSSDGGVMRGLPGIDGNIAYDGSDIRQGY